MSGVLGKCLPTRWLQLLGFNPNDEDDQGADQVLILLYPNDREGALANIRGLIPICRNDHAVALVRSL